MGSAINQNKSQRTIDAWRVAHVGLAVGGILLLALASVIPKLALSGFWLSCLAWSFIASTYGFVVALPYGAIIGERGLKASTGGGLVVWAGNLVGAGGSLAGAVILLMGAAFGIDWVS